MGLRVAANRILGWPAMNCHFLASERPYSIQTFIVPIKSCSPVNCSVTPFSFLEESKVLGSQ